MSLKHPKFSQILEISFCYGYGFNIPDLPEAR